MLFWLNVHGSWLLGWMLLGAFVVGETVRTLLRHSGALERRRLAPLYITASLLLPTMLINPFGLDELRYVTDTIGDPSVERFVSEWQPPAPHGFFDIVFFGSVLCLVAVLSQARSRVSLTDLLLLCGFLWMAFSGERHILWYAMVAAPILAGCIDSPRAGRRRRVAPSLRLQCVNGAIALLLVTSVVWAQPWSVRSFPLARAHVASTLPSPAPPLLSSATPLGAAEYLSRHPAGKLYTGEGYASYLIWRLPNQRVFVDPRFELYPPRTWEDSLKVGSGDVEPLVRYGIDTVLLQAVAQRHLSEVLTHTSGWRREYVDTWSEVWRYHPRARGSVDKLDESPPGPHNLRAGEIHRATG